MNRRIWIPIFVLTAILFGACGFNININLEQGSGKVTTETRSVSGFDKVVLSGIGDLDIVQGQRESLEIEAEDNVIPNIKTEVSDGTLKISFDRKTIIPTKSIKFHLVMRDVRGLETQGVSNIDAKSLKTDQLNVGISGTGNINIRNLTAQHLIVHVSGAGSFTTDGQVTDQEVTLSGAGNYEGQDLKSETAGIAITGIGRVTCWATERLNVTISGTGGVDYYGNPEISQQISGLGSLKHAGNK